MIAGDPVPSDPMDPRFWGIDTSMSAAGQAVTPESAEQLDVVQAVRARLSGTLSTLPLMVYERTDDADADEDGRKPAKDHPLYKLLHTSPNSRQTAQEFWADALHIASFWRNFYAEIVPGADSAIGSLEPIHPRRVQQIQRRADRRVYYLIRRLDNSGSDWFRDDEIFHVRVAPLTDDGLRGKSFFETAREVIGKAQAVEAFGAAFFRNGSSGGDYVQHPGKFNTKEDENDFIERVRKQSRGQNRFNTRLFTHGVTYFPSSIINNEAQFLETMKEMAVKLCRLWLMPPHMLGILDKAPLSNIEQLSLEYVIYTIAPWVSAIEQACSRDLLIGADQARYFVEYNVAGLLRGDFKTRWAGYAQGRQWGWLSVNDVRRLENMKGIGDAGDAYIVPMNMTPAGQPGADGQADAPGGPNDPANPDETNDDENEVPAK